MFQIGFWECVVVALVALWVLGPDQLPTVAHLAGRYCARLKKAMLSLKADFQEAKEVSQTTLTSGEKNTPPKTDEE